MKKKIVRTLITIIPDTENGITHYGIFGETALKKTDSKGNITNEDAITIVSDLDSPMVIEFHDGELFVINNTDIIELKQQTEKSTK